jgi:hypothetical protein
MRYFASIADPAGNTPRIAKGGYAVWPLLHKVNAVFHDPQVDYMTSGGKEGLKPAYNSIAFNWAGHVVFRSGWDPKDTWMFFEPGPRGNGHSDLAQLSVQLMAGGDWLLTDPGSFTYSDTGEDGAMNSYMYSTAAHNTLLVDGKGQRGSGTHSPPNGINQQAGDYHFADGGKTVCAEGAYTYGYGPQGEVKVTHHRRIVYEPSTNRFQFTDTCTGQGVHDFAVHWQFPAAAQVAVETNNNVSVITEHVRMTMQFAGNYPLRVDVVRGQKTPEILGWFSQHYGHLIEAPLCRVRWRSKLPANLRTTLTIEPKP